MDILIKMEANNIEKKNNQVKKCIYIFVKAKLKTYIHGQTTLNKKDYVKDMEWTYHIFLGYFSKKGRYDTLLVATTRAYSIPIHSGRRLHCNPCFLPWLPPMAAVAALKEQLSGLLNSMLKEVSSSGLFHFFPPFFFYERMDQF